ncbi:MAG: hypothetical protein ABS942_13915 [Solibacillus sp.]
MTKWKDEIDVALGIDPKFSEALQNKILKKATKRTFHWRYALTAVSFVLVALLLFLTGPTQVEQEVTTVTPFERLILEASVDEFYISTQYTEETRFFARDSSRYVQVHEFKSVQDISEMQQFLQVMKLVETSMEHWSAKDVLITMSNGEQLKLKVVRKTDRYLVQDVYTKLVYEVMHTESKAYERSLEKINRSTLSVVSIFLISGVMAGIAIISARLLKMPKIKREQKQDWKSTSIAIALVLVINGYLYYLRVNEYVMQIDVHFILVVLPIIGVQFFLQKEDAPFKKKVLDWLIIALGVVYIWILMNFG